MTDQCGRDNDSRAGDHRKRACAPPASLPTGSVDLSMRAAGEAKVPPLDLRNLCPASLWLLAFFRDRSLNIALESRSSQDDGIYKYRNQRRT